MTDWGSKNPLQLARFKYKDAKIFGTQVWGGSLDFNVWCPQLAIIFYIGCFKLSIGDILLGIGDFYSDSALPDLEIPSPQLGILTPT